MSVADSSSLKFWELVSHIGFWLVLIGVVVEGVEHFKRWIKKEDTVKRVEFIGWAILVLGLAMELLADPRIRAIADREAARLNNEAGKARADASAAIKQAADATLHAAESNERAQRLEKETIELKAKLQWRTISPQQATNLVKLLTPNPAPKTTIFVTVNSSDPEASLYAKQIADIIRACDFEVRFIAGLVMLDDPSESIPTGLRLKAATPLPKQAAILCDAFKEVGIQIDCVFGNVPNGHVELNVFPKPR